MLDCGIEPRSSSIENMYTYMIDNISCGGCSGEVEVSIIDKEHSSSEYVIKSM